MESSNTPTKLGIIGGGQLALMLIPPAHRLGLHVTVLDRKGCPAEASADHWIEGSPSSEEDVKKLLNQVDVVTIEIDQANTHGLEALERSGVCIGPPPRVVSLIQNKILQKKWLKERVPTSDFVSFSQATDLNDTSNLEAEFLPSSVLKLATGGYDGRGVFVFQGEQELNQILSGLGTQSFLIEKKVSIQKELSLLITRGVSGEIQSFPIVEMLFDPKLNQLEAALSPATLTQETEQEILAIGRKIVADLEHVGILAIELFLDTENQVWVNEISARVHNSGHHTIEANPVSQFEQHLRAILGKPLLPTIPAQPCALFNLLGEDGHTGPTHFEGLDKIENETDVFVHEYGKKETRPGRKMGHMTLLASTPQLALEKGRRIHPCLQVISR